MIKYFLFLFALVLVFSLYSRRFANPYKLIFIFGKKGAGKSCLMIKEMKRYLRRKWFVYTDMQDCILPGVRIISSADYLSKFRPEFHSAIFLDEVGVSFDNRNYKNFPAGLRDFFKFQRKYKCRVYMNSQSFDVDVKIRNVTDSMILQSSIGNVISVSRPIQRSITLTEPSAEAESRIADRLKFSPIWRWRFYWMPRYFKYFDSFSAPERDLVPFSQVEKEVKSLFKRKVPLHVVDLSSEKDSVDLSS